MSNDIALKNTGITPASFEDLFRFAKCVASSGLAPKGMEKPETIATAIEMGMEIGLRPMQALQNIAVINGRPSVWGDAAPGLVLASGLCEVFDEFFEGKPFENNFMAVCVAKRKGQSAARWEFSVDDAKRAGLWDKPGPWKQYPKRMLQMRARGFALRDKFADVLKGLRLAEEVQDIPRDVTDESEVVEKPNTLAGIAAARMAQSEPIPNAETGELPGSES